MDYSNILKEAILRKKFVVPDGVFAGTFPKEGAEEYAGISTEYAAMELVSKLDASLIRNGYFLSQDLVNHLVLLKYETLEVESKRLVDVLKELVGSHVEHNVYFKNFPLNVPNTFDFWMSTILEFVLSGDTSYGRYQHTYANMADLRNELDLEKEATHLRKISLGKSLEKECLKYFEELIYSSVPLSEEDKDDLNMILATYNFPIRLDPPVKENLAIANGYKILRKDFENLRVFHPIDVLRSYIAVSHKGEGKELRSYIAVSYKGEGKEPQSIEGICPYLESTLSGDVTLETNTPFGRLGRPLRRKAMELIESCISWSNMDDVLTDCWPHREKFKRLLSQVHPSDYANKFPVAYAFSHGIHGNRSFRNYMNDLHGFLHAGKIDEALSILAPRPGLFARYLDFALRSCRMKEKVSRVLDFFREASVTVSSKVLVSLFEHFNNRNRTPFRLFINRKGTNFVQENDLVLLDENTAYSIIIIVFAELKLRFEQLGYTHLYFSEKSQKCAIPKSAKHVPSGLDVQTQGSRIPIDRGASTLRFFVYWKEKTFRTDYDLSLLRFDSDFNFCGQVSYTNLLDENVPELKKIVHSGDLTESEEGASEFIDVQLESNIEKTCYLAPCINIFDGESFSDVSECFAGCMPRVNPNDGLPFEPSTVMMKSDVRNPNGSVCIPFAVKVSPLGCEVVWIHQYLKGLPKLNRTENNSSLVNYLIESFCYKSFYDVETFANSTASSCNRINRLQGSHPQGKLLVIKQSFEGMPEESGLFENVDVVSPKELHTLVV
mgnify:CR=1 FL=1